MDERQPMEVWRNKVVAMMDVGGSDGAISERMEGWRNWVG